ncbi:hypothetical protein JQ629_22780 [Bradyrhizobium sp. AUGA SZCCT0222]|uniref:hypothetical protein n=1 Tax=Bradyrhizobium sp. AUGA SZCCT0222 TaxID=2807668 RepID=UPI001BAC7481|nr:hypothetical protein [Bradyrhizobium sp. AUGA SZCCT0222]MBR1270304.1 hypothetical protein [Bradyrhizobium sp. AUGA SZCCT0222]
MSDDPKATLKNKPTPKKAASISHGDNPPRPGGVGLLLSKRRPVTFQINPSDHQRLDFFFFAFFVFLGIIFLTAFFAFLAIDFAALTTCLVTDFLAFLATAFSFSVLTFSTSSSFS